MMTTKQNDVPLGVVMTTPRDLPRYEPVYVRMDVTPDGSYYAVTDVLARDQAREAAIRELIAKWREWEQAFRYDLANARSPEWSDRHNEIAEAILRSSASDWQRAVYDLEALLTPPQEREPQ